jgi:D-inositol-3-phosphate glycosyltransferase
VLEGDRRAARRQVLPPSPEFDDAFIVLNANRNQPRKRIDLTIEGFALFAQGKPDNVKLYLHMGLEDAGWNLAVMARRHGIEHRLILSSPERGVPTASEARLNLIYNACDVGLNTSTGEGWGLVSFEHGATGAAQIVGRHSACAELWEGAAELMQPSYRLTTERTLIDGWYVTPETVAAAIQKLYADRDLRLERGRQAHANATRPEYAWHAIADRWRALFDDVIRTHPYSAAALRREAAGITSPR